MINLCYWVTLQNHFYSSVYCLWHFSWYFANYHYALYNIIKLSPKKMLKIEHLLHTKLLFEISNLLYLTHSSYFFLNVFSHFGAWFPKESPWRHKKALKVHHNIVIIFKINSCILYLRGFRTNKIAIASVTIIFSFFCFFCQLVAVEHSLLQIFNFRLDVVHILM